MQKRKYGFIKSEDGSFKPMFRLASIGDLPNSVDLRSGMPPVWDQGEIGSCTAHALAAAYAFDQAKEHQTVFDPSRLFLYWLERREEGTISNDAGAMIADGVNALRSTGICKSDLWPYLEDQFAETPNQNAFLNATLHKAIDAGGVCQTANSIRAALAQGYPVACGINVYTDFEDDHTAHTGAVTLPSPSQRADPNECLGGHAILLCGYEHSQQMFLFRNSWGQDWGISGYGFIPYEYITDPGLCSDLWCIRSVEKSG